MIYLKYIIVETVPNCTNTQGCVYKFARLIYLTNVCILKCYVTILSMLHLYVGQ